MINNTIKPYAFYGTGEHRTDINLGGFVMDNLTELEVENLRHLIGAHGLVTKKLETYAQSCRDRLKKYFRRNVPTAKQAQQHLMTFLG